MTPRTRRDILRMLGGASLVPLVGCGGSMLIGDGGTSDVATGSDGSATGSDGSSIGECPKGVVPEETGGPYPGDGTNGPNVLTQSGIVRSDIRSSFGTMSGVADGVLLTVRMAIVNLSSSCAPLAGYAVYAWHCTRDGLYSLYTLPGENYLRGVQATGADGTLTFTTIFPGAYSGRWPHIHFEIYPSLATAMSASNRIKTSQMALPKDACDAVYATTGYESSVKNLAATSLTSDMVFSDGASLQTPSMAGNVTSGYIASLVVGVNA